MSEIHQSRKVKRYSLPLPPQGKRSHASLSERLKKVEDECRLKEEERVNLELEMTEVKESLKKALNGGVTLGLTIQPKAGSSGLQVRDAVVLYGCHRCQQPPLTLVRVSVVACDPAANPGVFAFLQLRHQ